MNINYSKYLAFCIFKSKVLKPVEPVMALEVKGKIYFDELDDGPFHFYFLHKYAIFMLMANFN